MVHYPLRGRSVHFQRVLASPASFTAANMIHIGRVQSIETRGIPVLSLVAELNDYARSIQATPRVDLVTGTVVQWVNHPCAESWESLAFTVGP